MLRVLRIIIQISLAATVLWFVVPVVKRANRKMELGQQLINEHSKTAGFLEDQYREVTIKTRRGEQNAYTVYFRFTVDGKEYRGHDYFDAPPTTREVEVCYKPSNPHVNALDPVKKLETYQGGSLFLYFIIVLMVAVIIHALYLLSKRERRGAAVEDASQGTSEASQG